MLRRSRILLLTIFQYVAWLTVQGLADVFERYESDSFGFPSL